MTANTEITELIRSELCRFLQDVCVDKAGVKLDMDNPAAEVSAPLGFDTGYFFLKGLSRYGSELEKNMQRMDLVPIQTGFKFQRVNNWGGFINKKVFFVHFTKNYELVKLDYD